MSEKQNEVVTEKFIADFALIDASVVQKKTAWDIANENPAYSFVAFFWKPQIHSLFTIETSSFLLENLFLSASISKSPPLINETPPLNGKTASVNNETAAMIWK